MVKELSAAPSVDLISTQLSTRELTFRAGGAPVFFDVMVTNHSDRFATFQVEVLAAGIESSSTHRWYKLSPEICTKKPPGDSTRFTVQLFNPPRPGYAGLMKLTVRVFSLELREADSRQLLNLIVQGNDVAAPTLELSACEFTGYPGDRIKIPFSVQSNSQRVTNISLHLSGIDPGWLPESNERRFHLAPNELIKDVFECHIPALTQAPSRIYPLRLEASQPQAETVCANGTLTVLPQGFVIFQSQTPSQRLPVKRRLEPRVAGTDETARVAGDETAACYALQLENHSNLEQPVRIEADFWQGTAAKTEVALNPLVRWKRNRVRYQDLLQRSLDITPDTATLALAQPAAFTLRVQQPRPWFGWTRKRWIQVKAIAADPRVDMRDDMQLLELRLLPRLPFWFQLAGATLGLLLAGAIGWRLLHVGHTAPVNTLRLSGLASDVISGADDQTLHRWKVIRNQLVSQGTLQTFNKAVRVVRYRPVDNDMVAVGFENGEMQLVHVLTGTASTPFSAQKDDRVFDLVFTNDSRTLFSGHGSGQVVQWSLDAEGNATKVRDRQVGFAINAMALVGPDQRYLAIAGRFNQLVLWDLKTNQLQPINIGTGSERDYILSLATPAQKPYLLATANNRGTISTWDLRPCFQGGATCKALDAWTPDKAVNAVAFSADGCYLASAGESGNAILWSLTETGDRSTQKHAEQTIGHSNKRLTTIDVARTKDEILVSFGGAAHNVELRHVKAENVCH
ncbi:MAG: hypothetical protein KME45_19405 [Stenomitos rutilans HA7619-LM2]|jgi:WD40 repeat protein|nr:hypothetical protein [Stenomitos rutilans HA7619-LM2]